MKGFIVNLLFCLKLLIQANLKNFLILLFVNILSVTLPILNLYLNKLIINEISSNLFKIIVFEEIVKLIILYFSISAIISLFKNISEKISVYQVQSLTVYLNSKLIKKSFEIDISYFDNPKDYDEIELSKENASSLYNVVFSTILCINDIIMFVMFFIICINVSLYLTILVLIFLIPSLLYKVHMEKGIYDFTKEQYRDIRKNNYFFGLLFHKAPSKEIRFYNLGRNFLDKYLSTIKNLSYVKLNFTKEKRKRNLILTIPSEILQLIIRLITIYQVINRKYTIGDFYYISEIFQNLYSTIMRIQSNISMFAAYNDKINDFKKYFMYKESSVKSGSLEIKEITQIEFKNVSFIYPNTQNYVIKDLSFKVSNTENLMIIGKNGSGKSTVVKLLARFYEPTSGEILINDINIEEYNTEYIRTFFSVIFQDFNIYSFSLRENIALSKLSELYNDEKIKNSLKYSNLDNKTFGVHHNLDLNVTRLFDNTGLEFSGGQKQKLAIARAIFRDADVILLDEPTASLDPESENEILELLSKLYSNRMLIIISHRLSNCHSMDKIIYLEEGKLLGAGTHDWLMKNIATYKEFYNLQAQKYERDELVGLHNRSCRINEILQ